jgi:glycosyltransferase involved in cell wall biosynthesis
MKVSIIIPACNEEKYIEKTLRNIPSKYEIIVVCNGCTDNTEQIAKKFPVKLISIQQRGTSRAKNIGAREATGGMLIFLDADIIINENIIQAISKTKYDIGTIKLLPNLKKLKAYIYTFIRNFRGKFLHAGGVIFCKKRLFLKTGGFNENLKFREDTALIKKIKTFGSYGFINIPGTVNLRRLEKMGYLRSAIPGIKSIFKKEIDYPIIR